ncbi:phage minor capsid protein [Halobacillus ihumii]|uniref:phage minor capsid protein n=1 Tax=Halobacillus ihumii TaxID=2686092 RepID=UPI0013D6BF24|nr:phage minor capsid protein [Halobacillus ihumii]
MAKPKWDLELPEYEEEIDFLVRIYGKAIEDILNRILELSTYGKDKEISQAQMRKVLAYVASRLRTVDKESEEWAKEKIETAFKLGQAETIVALGEAASFDEAIGMVAASETIVDARRQLVTDTYKDLLQANNKMKEETIKMVRNVVREQQAKSAAMNQGRRSATYVTKKELRKMFKKTGNVGIVDKAGRRWKLHTYAEMVTRTKMLQAHVEGTRLEAKERNVDLAIVSDHNAEDACRKFEGQIISMNGETEGFMTYEELRRSNLIFHPNCRHKITPVRDLDILPQDIRDKFEENRSEAERLLKKQKNK